MSWFSKIYKNSPFFDRENYILKCSEQFYQGDLFGYFGIHFPLKLAFKIHIFDNDSFDTFLD